VEKLPCSNGCIVRIDGLPIDLTTQEGIEILKSRHALNVLLDSHPIQLFIENEITDIANTCVLPEVLL
jgi:hypothetical protein